MFLWSIIKRHLDENNVAAIYLSEVLVVKVSRDAHDSAPFSIMTCAVGNIWSCSLRGHLLLKSILFIIIPIVQEFYTQILFLQYFRFSYHLFLIMNRKHVKDNSNSKEKKVYSN